jgi:MFS transporter, FHS family, glucose/mannose:H+ symporter
MPTQISTLDVKRRPQRATLRLMFTACAGLFSCGIVMALVGAILPELQKSLGFGLERAGFLQSIVCVAQVPTLLLVGPLIDRFGKKPVLVAGWTLFAVALVGIAHASSYAPLATMIFLLGLGGSCLDGGSSTLIPDVYTENPFPAMNVGNLFFSLGAVFFPLLVLLTEKLGLAPILAFLSVLMAILASSALRQSFPAASGATGFDWREAQRVVLHPAVVIVSVVLFFYVALEISTAGWVRTYLDRSFGATARTSGMILTLFWASQALGRLVASRLVRVLGGPELVLLSGMGAVLGTLLVVLAPTASIAAAGIAVCGLTYAPIFPTSVMAVGIKFPTLFGTIFGIFAAAGFLGGVFLPAAIGYLAGATTLREGLGLLVATAGLMVVAQGICIRYERRRGSPIAQ